MSQPNSVDQATEKRASAIVDAQDQAREFAGFTASTTYTAPSGAKFVVPNVGLLDDDQQERFDQLNFALSKCDKHPDTVVPGRTVTARDADGTEIVTEYPPQTLRGGFVQPYQKDGELITPNYNAQLVKALLGDVEFKRFQKEKGRSSEFAVAVKNLSEGLTEREAADPKSEGSAGALADVSD